VWRAYAEGTRSEFFLPRPLSLHGFCSTDLSRKFARNRNVLRAQAGKRTTWASRAGVRAVLWPLPTRAATGASTADFASRSSPSPSSLCEDSFGVDLKDTVDALDASTIRSVPSVICLGSVSLDQGGHQVAHAVGSARKSLRFSTSAMANGTTSTSGPAVARAGCFYIWTEDTSTSNALSVARGESFFVTRAKSNLKANVAIRIRSIEARGDCDRLLCSPVLLAPRLRPPCVASDSKTRHGKRLVFLTNQFILRHSPSRGFIVAGGKSSCFSMDQAASSYQKSSSAPPRTPSNPIWIAVSVYVLVAIVKKLLNLSRACMKCYRS